jgi:hypothetical protein
MAPDLPEDRREIELNPQIQDGLKSATLKTLMSAL